MGGAEIVSTGNPYMYNVFFLRSDDNGRTWNYVSNILSEGICEEGSEGLCEPCMTIAPDGRYFILMRSGEGFPCYYSYSLDKGQSWNSPQAFADVGVDPQLLTLDCGVTLASYGRPGIFIRATDDPACLSWKVAKRIALSEENIETPSLSSCCYTSLVMIDKYTALLAYSDFNYPALDSSIASDANIKTILVRKIHVKYDY